MKHLLILPALFLVAFASGQTIQSIQLRDIGGKMVNTTDLVGQGKPVIISFWATWCSPCKRELNNYAEYFEDWQDEFGVSVIAVSIDDQRTANRVAPYIHSVEWPYTVLLDPNREFARTMQVNNVPHTFIIDADGNVVWQNNNYSDGDEDEVYEQLQKL